MRCRRFRFKIVYRWLSQSYGVSFTRSLKNYQSIFLLVLSNDFIRVVAKIWFGYSAISDFVRLYYLKHGTMFIVLWSSTPSILNYAYIILSDIILWWIQTLYLSCRSSLFWFWEDFWRVEPRQTLKSYWSNSIIIRLNFFHFYRILKLSSIYSALIVFSTVFMCTVCVNNI